MSTVSIVMTAYNREAYLAEAIESVLASDFHDFELIIVDDNSIDETREIARQFAALDSRIKIFDNEKNKGQFENRNYAGTLAKGRYLMFVDSDDRIFSDTIRSCVSALQNNPSADFLMLCRTAELCGNVLTPRESIYTHFFSHPFLTIGPGGIMFKREFYSTLPGFPVQYGAAGDMYFNLLAASKGNIYCFCKEFLNYRIHEGQALNDSYGYLYNNYNYLNDAVINLDLPLTDKEKKWVINKLNRRFTVNVLRYLIATKSIRKSRNLIARTPFRLRDALAGIFH